jgi:hypothetical protein
MGSTTSRGVFLAACPEALRSLAAWLVEQQVEEVVMESTAQYWKPVWGTLERYWKPICQTREGALATSGTNRDFAVTRVWALRTTGG